MMFEVVYWKYSVAIDEMIDVAGAELETEPDPVDMLDREKCIQLLAELRHAKWFQVMLSFK